MKIFYHNITKNKLNENDFSEINYTDGDTVFKTEAGNAILMPIFGAELAQLEQSLEEE